MVLELIPAALIGAVAGALGRPLVAKAVAPLLAKKVLADAKALIAKAEADAAALENAKAIVAAVPAPAPAASAAGTTANPTPAAH